MDIALLGLDVTSGPVKKATERNEGFSKSAKGAERSAGSLERASRGLSGTMGALARSIVPLVAGLVSFQAAANAFSAARGFNAALAETSTLVGGAADEMAIIEGSARSLAREFGGPATAQVSGFYQAISAGAGDAAAATELLTTANQLAIGGVTDVTTSVDVLTTAMNVYKDSNLTATQASDALFVGMKAGKTTISELASGIGKLLPLGSALGLSFDELVAGTAALTKGGISTAESITGMRATLAAITGPSQQATELAKDLGIEFSAAGLAATEGGLAAFMADIVEKTGGSTAAMQQLFGGVEATGVALAFAGQSGTFFGEILDDMAGKAGSTSDAFGLVADSLDQRLNVQLGNFGDVALSVGNFLLSVAVPALEVLAATFGTIVTVIGKLASPYVAVFNLFTRGTEQVKESTITWTQAVDQQIQAEFDLESALLQVTGANAAAGTAAIASAQNNLTAAGVAHERAVEELALAKALLIRQGVEKGSLQNAFSLFPSVDISTESRRAEEDFSNTLELLTDLEKGVNATGDALKRAVVGVDQAAVVAENGITAWDGNRIAIDRVADSLTDLGTAAIGGAGGGTDGFADRLSALQNNLITEREMVDAWYSEAQDVLADQRAQEILGEEEHKQALLRVEELYQDQINAIRGAGQGRQLGEMADFFSAAAQVAQSGGSGLIRVAKTLGAVEATINAYRAAAQALADPTVGFWGKAAAYASVLATGLGAVKAIKGGGGGGGGSSGGAGGSSFSSSTQQAPQQTPQRISIESIDPNAIFYGQQLHDLVGRINKENKNLGYNLEILLN